MSERTRILIVDDHPLFREGVVRTLRAAPDFEIVGEATSAAQAICCAQELLPDMILLDVTIPGGGLHAATTIKARVPCVSIAMLTASEEQENVVAAFRAGARGYILKGISGQELVRVLRDLQTGTSYVTPSLAASVLSDNRRWERDQASRLPGDALTGREHEILGEVAAGLSNKEIARRLILSEQTVKHYMTNILQKLHVRNRVEAALLAHRGGLVNLQREEYET